MSCNELTNMKDSKLSGVDCTNWRNAIEAIYFSLETHEVTDNFGNVLGTFKTKGSKVHITWNDGGFVQIEAMNGVIISD